MKVTLRAHTQLQEVDHAIGLCWAAGDYEGDKASKRIERVALQNKHSSILEFVEYIFDIEASTRGLLEMALASFVNIKYVDIAYVGNTNAHIKFNARTLVETPMPQYIIDLLPEDIHFLIGYKQVKGFPMYMITKEGVIHRVSKTEKNDTVVLPKEIRPFINKHGYEEYILFDEEGNRKHKATHRLLMETFYGDGINEHVNHKDGNKLNNSVDNLEWCTASENEQHSYKILGKVVHNKGATRGRSHVAKPIEQLDLEGKHIAYFECALDAQDELLKQGIKISSGALSDTLNGKNKQHKGFKWKFI